MHSVVETVLWGTVAFEKTPVRMYMLVCHIFDIWCFHQSNIYTHFYLVALFSEYSQVGDTSPMFHRWSWRCQSISLPVPWSEGVNLSWLLWGAVHLAREHKDEDWTGPNLWWDDFCRTGVVFWIDISHAFCLLYFWILCPSPYAPELIDLLLTVFYVHFLTFRYLEVIYITHNLMGMGFKASS